MKFKKELRKSNKSERDYKYLVIDQLPSGFRNYDVDVVFVRGLLWEESIAISKFIGENNSNFKQLVNIYKDIIQGIDIEDLEIPDFIVLLTISTIYTLKDFGWVPNVRCSHIVKNPEIKKIENKIKENYKKINDLENKNEDQDQDQKNNKIKELKLKIKNLENELELLPDEVQCNGIIKDKITLDDLEFVESKIKKLPIPIYINEKEFLIGPLTVKDQIMIEDYKVKNKVDEIEETILNYAVLIKNDIDLKEKINLLKYCEVSDIKQISQIENDLYIDIKPVKKKCPKCGKINNIEITLDQIRAFP